MIEIGDTEQNEPGIEPEEEDNLLNPINERVLGEQNWIILTLTHNFAPHQ